MGKLLLPFAVFTCRVTSLRTLSSSFYSLKDIFCYIVSVSIAAKKFIFNWIKAQKVWQCREYFASRLCLNSFIRCHASLVRKMVLHQCTVHPQNVRFQNVRFQNVRFQNVWNVRLTKRQVYKTSGLQNVRFTKRQVFKTSGCKKHPFIFCTCGWWKSTGSVASMLAGKVMAMFYSQF